MIDLVPDRRWPLHPKPRKLEGLEVWVIRIASAYGVSYDTFLRKALDRTGPGARNLDTITEAQLAMLASGTGMPVEQLRGMTSAAIAYQISERLSRKGIPESVAD